MDNRIFTIGEVMLRISPTNPGEKIEQTKVFRIEPGGSESNVAVALAQLGHRVTFLTSLPDNPMKNLVLRYLSQYGVETSCIATRKERLGIYWTEHGVGPRAASVFYDREDSSFSHLCIDDFDWNTVNRSAHWFHFSGIVPALSKKSCANIFAVLDKIDKKIKVSIDLNYRYKLWRWTKKDKGKIHKIMHKLCSRAYLVTGNETDFQESLGYPFSKKEDTVIYEKIAKELFNKIKNLKFIAVSLRTSHSASRNDWSGILYARDGKKLNLFEGPYYKLDNIVDRVGTGDSFSAGIIHGILQYGKRFQKTIDFATTLGALNHTVLGDASQFSQKDVEKTLESHGKGRIER